MSWDRVDPERPEEFRWEPWELGWVMLAGAAAISLLLGAMSLVFYTMSHWG